MLQLDVQFLALVASVVIPGLVGLVAKARAERWFKALANAVLSFAAGAVAIAINANGSVRLGDWIFQALITYGMSELAYQRLYKPTGAAEYIASVSPGGIGPEREPEAPVSPTGASSTTQFHNFEVPPVPAEPAAPITMPGVGHDLVEEVEEVEAPVPVKKAARPRKAAQRPPRLKE